MTLDMILEATRRESADRQNRHPLDFVARKVEKMGPTRGFARALRRQPFSVIAEIKRKSPSMGEIAERDVPKAIETYHAHPFVSAISVLTQNSDFGGTPEHLTKVRGLTQVRPKPILRKDFIFSPYEVYYSRWIGADAILLMANVMEGKKQFKELHDLATSIGLDVLCEIHDEAEIDLLPDTVKICGINSRRFKDVDQTPSMGVRLNNALGLAPSKSHDTRTDLKVFDLLEKLEQKLSGDCIKIAESGLSSLTIGDILKRHRFNAALVGTSLLKNKAGVEKELDSIKRDAETAMAARVQPQTEPAYAGSK
jgi:indole-3-glycerol phosphate synthase